MTRARYRAGGDGPCSSMEWSAPTRVLPASGGRRLANERLRGRVATPCSIGIRASSLSPTALSFEKTRKTSSRHRSHGLGSGDGFSGWTTSPRSASRTALDHFFDELVAGGGYPVPSFGRSDLPKLSVLHMSRRPHVLMGHSARCSDHQGSPSDARPCGPHGGARVAEAGSADAPVVGCDLARPASEAPPDL